MSLKKIVAAAAVSGALGFSALGLGAGVANAQPHWPNPPGPGHGHGHGEDWGDWGDGQGEDWGYWGDGPWYGPGISACVSATGPWGYVTGSACT